MIVHLSRTYSFPASHRLHSTGLTEGQNHETYGKCNNPHGHGHNYEIELTVAGPVDEVTGRVIDIAVLDRLAGEEIVSPLQYKYLNEEVSAFRTVVPTTENLAVEVDRRLRNAWPDTFGSGSARLEKVRIWETERNICEIANQNEQEASSR